LFGGIFLTIIMVWHGRLHITILQALYERLYYTIIMVCYGVPYQVFKYLSMQDPT
jgi:hypothetical protein